MALPEMAAGGVWMICSSDLPPVYCLGLDTMARCLSSGWVVVDDPRSDSDAPRTDTQESVPESVATQESAPESEIPHE